MSERWLPVLGYEGRYEVSDLGRVRSTPRARTKGGLLTLCLNDSGYHIVWIDGLVRRVHRLVLQAFVGPCPDGQEVRHLDGNPVNNLLSNLAYGTKSENQLDTVRHGRHREASKTHCPAGHPYDSANTRVYRGMRYCRACRHKGART